MEDRLRECPWCKCEASIHVVDATGCYDRRIRYAYQPGCSTDLCPGEWGGSSYDSPEEARDKWNTRAIDQDQSEILTIVYMNAYADARRKYVPLLEKMAEALKVAVQGLSHGLQDTRASLTAEQALQEYQERIK